MKSGTTAHTAAKPALYMFDEVFSLEPAGKPASAPSVTNAQLAEAVAAARAEGHAAGLAEGRRAAEKAIAGNLAASLERLVAASAQMTERAEADRSEIEAAAVDLAMVAVGRLVPALIASEPTAEMAALLRECLAGIRDVPHIAVRISEDLVEPMRTRFDEVAAQAGFTGRVVVLGEPGIAPGDGRIDWADSGIVRDTGETRRAIEAAVDAFLAARSGQQPAPKDESDE